MSTYRAVAPRLLRAGFVALVGVVIASCATFSGEIPIDLDYPEEIYISPRNQDGIQDEVVLPLDVPELQGLRLAGYTVQVVSEAGDDVYSYGDQVFVDEGLLAGLSRPPAVEIPDAVRWNGVDYFDDWVDDGLYLLSVEAWDFDANRGVSPTVRVIVDNTPPDATIVAPHHIFSPNETGFRETLELHHENATVEDRWTARITDSRGRTVRDFEWTGTPGAISWDGTHADGTPAADGEYRYELASTDRAGNSFRTTLDEIAIDRRRFSARLAVSPRAFSPNADGVQDTVRLTIRADAPEEIAGATLSILSTRGRQMRTFGTDELATGTLIFDGLDDAGRRLPEGSYSARVDITYRNGYVAEAASQSFVLDVTAPRAVVHPSWRLFSPTAGSRRNTVPIRQNSSESQLWRGVIRNDAGETVRVYEWDGRLASFEWDGTGEDGELVPDGSYSYTLSATDEAGNTARYSIPRITLDTRPTPIRVTPRRAAFNPQADAEYRVVEFDLETAVRDGISRWQFAVVDREENEVMRHGPETVRAVPESIVWDGRTAAGALVEGEYYGRLEVEYEKGDHPAVTTEYPVRLDLSPPSIEVSMSPLPFQPVDDRVRNTLRIAASVRDPSGVRDWSAEILDPMGNRFLHIPAHEFRGGIFQWDGTSATGEWVQSASDYTLVVHAEDTVGNRTSREYTVPIDILVMRVGDRLQIVISSIYFKPYTADFVDVPADVRATNLATLDRLAEILARYRDHAIEIEGHAVRLWWDRPTEEWQDEEDRVLGPLSASRADAIRSALVDRGIESVRMGTTGRGGFDPVVPHGDLTERWKNRRVEFYLSQ